MDVSSASVIRRIKRDFENLTEIDEIVDTWNQLCERAWENDGNHVQFADVEKAAIAALAALAEEPAQRPGNVGHDISRMLNSFDYPTYLVTASGYVAASNASAWSTFSLDVGESIDWLPFSLIDAKKLSQIIIESLKQTHSSQPEMVLKRTCEEDGNQGATIAITTSHGPNPTALVFVITPKWKPASTQLLRNQFNLTKAEAEVLINFVDGKSTQEIAKKRSRSHDTVRAQFQSIRSKMGAKSQAELLRTTLSVAGFVSDIGEIANVVEHPHRRKAVILRKGGRRVELTMMGDFNGSPILHIATAQNYTFNAGVESALYDAGLCLVSICPPGFGETDPVPQGQDRIECLCTDIEAVLNQLEFENCLMLAYNASVTISYVICNRLSARFHHLAHVAAPPPLRFIHQIQTQSVYVNGILRAGLSHPGMKNILFRAAMKAWVTMGTRRFLKMQFSSKMLESDIIFCNENMREYEYATATSTCRGITDAAADIGRSFEDWTCEAEKLPINITVIHGDKDSIYTIDNTRRYAEHFSDKIDFIEVKNAGFPLLQSHTKEVLGYLTAAIANNV